VIVDLACIAVLGFTLAQHLSQIQFATKNKKGKKKMLRNGGP